MFRLVSSDIDSPQASPLDSAGGYVVFEGRVRNLNEGRTADSLEYEAFDQLAEKIGNEILASALTRFSVESATAVHRVGHLRIGEVAIRVEVAAAHRKAAFEACDWIVDEIKSRVPIWKKEHYADGDSGWIGIPDSPAASRAETAFYSRQTILHEVGAEGQTKLKNARVLVVGAGGLGSSALEYLAAAGIGTIGITEFDRLDESNLHRQVLFAHKDIGRSKAELAAERLAGLNPYISVIAHGQRLAASNSVNLIGGYDLVLDCTDNFATKFMLNDVCVRLQRPLIQASIYQYEGQLMVVRPSGPCLRCLWPKAPDEGCVGSCAVVGVLGVVPGVFGCLQAAEAIKLILGLPSPLRDGHLLLFDLLSFRQQLVRLSRNPDCPACGSGVLEEASFELDATTVDFTRFAVIDIREPAEIAMVPAISAARVPSDSFDITMLPRSDKYLLVCARGVRSSALARRLRESGDDRFYSLAGGVRSLLR